MARVRGRARGRGRVRGRARVGVRYTIDNDVISTVTWRKRGAGE